MSQDQQIAQEFVPFPNANKANEFIEAETDPAIRALMRLIHGEFLRAVLAGYLPEGGFDVLYCFKILQSGFSRKEALANALKGDYGDPNADLEWT